MTIASVSFTIRSSSEYSKIRSHKATLGAFRDGATRLQTSRHSLRSTPRRVITNALEPDNLDILVAGGGGVAMDVCKELKNMGAWVTMMQRTDSRIKSIQGMLALTHIGDAMDMESVEAAWKNMDDCKIVVSTLGGSPADPAVDSLGNINLINAAINNGVERFVLVTSIGTGDSKDAPPPQVYDVLKPVLVEKEKAEAHLKANADKMEFVIIRPGGLKTEPATNKGVLTEDTSICGAIHREDVAKLVCKACFSDAAKNKTLSAVDSEQLYGKPDFEVFVFDETSGDSTSHGAAVCVSGQVSRYPRFETACQANNGSKQQVYWNVDHDLFKICMQTTTLLMSTGIPKQRKQALGLS
eukprot:CAMPEP_0114257418 /NCGR_PEP_ID=MMETSP0058-20121206/18721_1 /TAXON_ID=36894 /ORGANISM="Pyramimonas parkeae, CCMP726" /LENGTH=354 /DNA_ID=CAMNT_0001372141 /DNA_START=83 /DNA_END=1148 /DNA_ORIENTATION=-